MLGRARNGVDFALTPGRYVLQITGAAPSPESSPESSLGVLVFSR